MAEEFVTITQVAERFGVRERVIKKYVDAGTIPFIKIGKAIRFRWSDVLAWAETLTCADPLKMHPATLTATPSVTNGIPKIPHGTSEPVIGLMRGPKGRNRERLAKG